jgi:hypothetical protein
MNNEPELFQFPELCDELVVVLNNFLEELLTQFQKHYFANALLLRRPTQARSLHRSNTIAPRRSALLIASEMTAARTPRSRIFSGE